MAFAAIGALFTAGAAGAAVTGTMVLAAVTEIGIAMTVVGAVTGSKSLMKLGGVMSLVGGVGGMIAGAAGGAAAGAAGVAEGAGAGSAAAAESAITGEAAFGGYAAEAGSAAAGEAGLSAGGLGADLGGQSMNSTMPDLTGSLDATSSATSADAARTMSLTPDATATGLQAPTVVGAQGPAAIQTPGAAYTPYENGFQSSAALSGAPTSSSSFWDTFSKFADKNKTLLNSGMQIVGGAMKGANEQSMFDQKVALEQQRMKQTSYGNSVANFSPKTGIIGGAR